MLKLLCLSVLVSAIWAKKEKSFINFGGFVCPREEKALGRCLKDTLNNYIPKLATGLPQFDVPPCEPLLIPALTVKQASGPVTVTSTYNDVAVSGPSTMRIKEVIVDTKRHQVIGKVFIPELKLKGHYNLDGRILMLPIEGEGEFTGKYGDIHAVVTIVLGRLPRHNDVDAVKCEDLKVNFNIGHAFIQMNNLFGGSSELGNAMNDFLNKNWQILAEELKNPLEDALRDFLKPLADHAFSTLNADDVIPL